MKKIPFLPIILIFLNIHSQLSLEEKIAQLLIIPSAEKPSVRMFSVLKTVIKQYKPGGMLFFLPHGDIQSQIETTKYYQSLSETPLFITQDLMRANFPKIYILGFVKDEKLLYEIAHEMARECQKRGVHWCFTPVVDVTTPSNTIIGTRAFGDNIKDVNRLTKIFIKAYNDVGVMSTAKHYPGHGASNADSHEELPTVDKSKEQLEAEDIQPFKVAIDSDVPAVMSAHLLTALDPQTPASLSPLALQYLRKNLHFDGLIIADALCMKAITKSIPQEKAAALALKAGNDIVILMSSKEGSLLDKLNDEEFYLTVIPAAIQEIKNLLTPEEIEEKYQRVKKYKERYVVVNLDNLAYNKDDYNGEYQKDLIQRLYNSAIVVQVDINGMFVSLDKLGTNGDNLLMDQANYKSITSQQLLDAKKIVIKITATQTGFNLMNYKFDAEYKTFVQELLKQYNEKILLILFANQYAAQEFDATNKIIAFEENEFTKKYVESFLL